MSDRQIVGVTLRVRDRWGGLTDVYASLDNVSCIELPTGEWPPGAAVRLNLEVTQKDGATVWFGTRVLDAHWADPLTPEAEEALRCGLVDIRDSLNGD